MNFQQYCITPDKTILEALEKIDEGARGIIYVCDNNVLLGVATDGDVRRYILKNGNLSNRIEDIVNKAPIRVLNTNNCNKQALMRAKKITSLPVVNLKGELLSIEFLSEEPAYKNTDINMPVVIMAGGKGTRLLPYTQVLPKPLIPIGDKTITERIMEQFALFGCTNFKMIINYKKDLIKAYFKECVLPYELSFADETKFMGTGGGLKLLEGQIKSTFFMTNCDVIIRDDYSTILKEHQTQGNLVTIVCAVKTVDIPYGVIELDKDSRIKNMQEKPSFSYITNTGFYVIEPEFLQKIPKDTFIHITDIIQKCIDEKEKIGVYPISSNSWLDMGQFSGMENMISEFQKD